MHLPKTGVSSALSALQKLCPKAPCTTIAFGIPEDPTPRFVGVARQELASTAISPLAEAGLFRSHDPTCVCLREPKATTRSFYKYFLAFKPKNSPQASLGAEKCRVKVFKSYLQFMLTERASHYYLHYLDPLYGAPGLPLFRGQRWARAWREQSIFGQVRHRRNHRQIDSFVQSILTAREVAVDRVEVER